MLYHCLLVLEYNGKAGAAAESSRVHHHTHKICDKITFTNEKSLVLLIHSHILTRLQHCYSVCRVLMQWDYKKLVHTVEALLVVSRLWEWRELCGSWSITNNCVHTCVFVQRAGVAQGVITGIRGLCNGLGPALFGFVFYLFHVDLNDNEGGSHSAVLPSSRNSSAALQGEDSGTLHQLHVVRITDQQIVCN